jgi:hypothetical protein
VSQSGIADPAEQDGTLVRKALKAIGTSNMGASDVRLTNSKSSIDLLWRDTDATLAIDNKIVHPLLSMCALQAMVSPFPRVDRQVMPDNLTLKYRSWQVHQCGPIARHNQIVVSSRIR